MKDFLIEIGEAFDDIKKEQEKQTASLKAAKNRGSRRR